MSTIHGVKCIHFYLCCFLQQFSQQRVVGFCGRLARGQQILSLQRAGLGIDDVALVVPHQANIRIVEAACDRLGCPMDKTAVNIHETGNTSSASIPLALFDAADQGRLVKGDLVLMVGFGAGMTAASAIMRWNGKGLSAQ